MKTLLKALFVSLVALASTACYDDYKDDFEDGTSVYFSYQNPYRTLVEDADSDNLTFTFGVMIGGLYENTKSWTVEYEFDESLLAASGVASQALPAAYYDLSNDNNNKVVIKSGDFLGEVTVTIPKNAFMSDPLALGGTYALPIKITETESDYITEDKGYTVIALKYINKYHATYYLVGTDTKYDSTGTTVIDTETYDVGEENYVGNLYFTLTTTGQYTLNLPYVGGYNSTTDSQSMTMDFSNSSAITLTNPVGVTSLKDITVTPYASENLYTGEDVTSFDLSYTYTDSEGYIHKVVEKLVFLKQELAFETW